MNKLIEVIFTDITYDIQENDVYKDVNEMIPEYLDDGWEEEFDDYEETGRNAAEHEVLNDLIMQHGGKDLNIDDHYDLFNKFDDYYGLSVE